jgi:hypothetical protein
MAAYPALRGLGVNAVTTPMPGDPRKLEFWPPGDPGDQRYPRPAGLPSAQPGVQIIDPATTPRDVAGDITSHWLVKQDPRMREMYGQFADTFNTPRAQRYLQRDYAHAQANEGEQRPFEDWKTMTRIPAYLRGRMFDQWSPQEQREYYTPDQIDMLNRMSGYLHGHGAGGAS